jgi:hypothetical protein
MLLFKRILTALLLAVGSLSIPSYALAQSDLPGSISDVEKSIYISSSAFTSVTMGSARETDAIRTQGFSAITFFLTFTQSAATAVTMACKAGPTSSTINYSVQVLYSYTNATASSDTHTWSQAVSSSESWPWTVTLMPGYNYLKCTFTATGGGSSDLLTLSAFAR